MSSFYKQGQYLEKHPKWHGDDSFWKAQQIIKVLSDEFMAENFQDKKLSIVDVGCGAGGVLGNLREMLLSRGYEANRCVGIDVADDALKLATKGCPDIEFRNCELAEIGEHFDVGLLIDVIEHVEDPGGFVESCAAFCDHLVFHVPLDDNYNNKIRNRNRYYFENVGHIHCFNLKTALGFLEMSNLRVIDLMFTKAFLCSRRSSALARMALPIRLLFSSISESRCARILGGLSLMVLTAVRK